MRKLQKDRNSPLKKGYRKPMQKAAKVGSKNSHTMRLMGRRISREFSAASSRRCFGSFMTPLSYLCFFRAAPGALARSIPANSSVRRR